MENKKRTQLNCETTATTDFLTEELGIMTYLQRSVSGKIIEAVVDCGATVPVGELLFERAW